MFLSFVRLERMDKQVADLSRIALDRRDLLYKVLVFACDWLTYDVELLGLANGSCGEAVVARFKGTITAEQLSYAENPFGAKKATAPDRFEKDASEQIQSLSDAERADLLDMDMSGAAREDQVAELDKLASTPPPDSRIEVTDFEMESLRDGGGNESGGVGNLSGIESTGESSDGSEAGNMSSGFQPSVSELEASSSSEEQEEAEDFMPQSPAADESQPPKASHKRSLADAESTDDPATDEKKTSRKRKKKAKKSKGKKGEGKKGE